MCDLEEDFEQPHWGQCSLESHNMVRFAWPRPYLIAARLTNAPQPVWQGHTIQDQCLHYPMTELKATVIESGLVCL